MNSLKPSTTSHLRLFLLLLGLSLLVLGLICVSFSVSLQSKLMRKETNKFVPINSTTQPITTTKSVKVDLCNCHGENFCFDGLDSRGRRVRGRPFNCSLYEKLRARRLLDRDAAKTANDFELLNSTDWSPVFVTPASSGHFAELRLFVKTIRSFYPESLIVVYDVGLTEYETSELQSWCNVEYRRLDFARYPPHVQNLKTYGFKLANVEALQTIGTFFYFDVSIRLITRNLTIFLDAVKNSRLLPLSLQEPVNHSVFAEVDPGMTKYFPLPLLITQMSELSSGIQFVSDSPYTRHVFKWWFLCAMTEDCISPPGSTVDCDYKAFFDHHRTYMNCHRYDQASMNLIILSHLFGPKRGAQQVGYTTSDWPSGGLNENLVAEVQTKQTERLKEFSTTFRIERDTQIYEEQSFDCEK